MATTSRDEQKNISPADEALSVKRVAAFFAVIGLLIFGFGLWHPFVYDDDPQIVQNGYVHKLSLIPALFTGGLVHAEAQDIGFFSIYYKPLFYTVLNLIVSIFGAKPFPIHLLQLGLHIINATLLFLILSRFIRQPLAFFLGLIFLVHPLNSEVVVCAADLQDVLFMFFGLLALFFVQRQTNPVLVTLMLLCSILSKETGVLFFAIVTIHVLLFRNKNLSKHIVAIGCASIAYLLLRLLGTKHELFLSVPSIIQQAPLSARIIGVPAIVTYYLGKVLVPINFSIGQEWLVERADTAHFGLPLLGTLFSVFCIFSVGWAILKKRPNIFPQYIFFGLWFSLGLALHLQIFPLDMTVADRWFYYPMAGLLGLTGTALSALWPEKYSLLAAKHNLIFRTSTTYVLILAALTIVRVSQWASPMKLYEHDLRFSKVSPQIDNLYGAQLMKANRMDEAKFYLDRSVSVDPGIGNNLEFLGVWHEMRGEKEAAMALYQQDINIDNRLSKAYAYAGIASITLYDNKNPIEALGIVKKAIEKYPTDEKLLRLLAVAEYSSGDKDAATSAAKRLAEGYPTTENIALYKKLLTAPH